MSMQAMADNMSDAIDGRDGDGHAVLPVKGPAPIVATSAFFMAVCMSNVLRHVGSRLSSISDCFGQHRSAPE